MPHAEMLMYFICLPICLGLPHECGTAVLALREGRDDKSDGQQQQGVRSFDVNPGLDVKATTKVYQGAMSGIDLLALDLGSLLWGDLLLYASQK